MKKLLKYISFSGLTLMFVAAILYFRGVISRDPYLIMTLVGTALWFIPVPFWMKRRLHHSE